MLENLEIRPSTPGDLQAIEAIYSAAFPEEDLLPLLRELLQLPQQVLSLVAAAGSSLIAHVAFTKGSIEGSPQTAALLGPLAVAPAWQGKGVGSQIVRNGLQQLQRDGIGYVFVLGAPGYYGRFGFSQEASVAAPYTLPAQWSTAWQSVKLGQPDAQTDAQTDALTGGVLTLPEPWLHPELWGP